MRYLFSILIVLIPACRLSLACGPRDRLYTAEEYFTFRICGEDMSGTGIRNSRSWRENPLMDNCRSWAKITSTDIPLEDIQQVVYHWEYDRLEKLHADAVAGKERNDNAFADWLIREKDTEITSFLLLAKQCEQTRAKQCSAWYYPVQGDEENTLLTEIVEKAKEYKGKRLFDRYTLQMMRALISLRQYNECLNIWLERKNFFHKGVIEEMAKNYAAGAYYHIGEITKAKRMFTETGDIVSYVFCMNKEGKTYDSYDMLPILYQREPNDKRLFHLMQNIIHYDIEMYRERYRFNRFYTEKNDHFKKNLKTLYDFTLNVLDEGKAKNLAVWYYTASFLSDKLRDTVQALEYIRQARELPAGQDLKDAIRVFDIYLKAKSAVKYDADFENYLYNELSWLDQKIVINLDSVYYSDIEDYICNRSSYYWGDMMRKIVISQVVPKCIASGYQTRALQLLNMADNRVLDLVGKFWSYPATIVDWGNSRRIYCSESKALFRPGVGGINDYDYSNDFFINLDSLGVQHIERLVVRMQNPLCYFDRFLNERSYVNMEYFYEIIGTQLLAAMRYKEAIHYLSQVSDEFMQTTNVYPYYKPEPKDYKLNFAKKMYALEQKIKTSKNPNDRAECMLTYAKELQNSIGPRWYLTRYYDGCWVNYPFYSQYQTDLYDNAVEKFEYMKQKAFKTFTDTERAAKTCWRLFSRVARENPPAKTMEYIREHCDVLSDYTENVGDYELLNGLIFGPDKELYKKFRN